MGRRSRPVSSWRRTKTSRPSPSRPGNYIWSPPQKSGLGRVACLQAAQPASGRSRVERRRHSTARQWRVGQKTPLAGLRKAMYGL